MDTRWIPFLYRLGCRVIGTILIIYGGVALIQDLRQLKIFGEGQIKEKTGPEENTVQTYHMYSNILYIITGISVLFAVFRYCQSVLKVSACITMALGAHPVLAELKIFRFEHTLMEIVSAFVTIPVILHFYAAFVLWRYAEEVWYKLEEYKLRSRLKYLQKIDADLARACQCAGIPEDPHTGDTLGVFNIPQTSKGQPCRLRSCLNAPETKEQANEPSNQGKSPESSGDPSATSQNDSTSGFSSLNAPEAPKSFSSRRNFRRRTRGSQCTKPVKTD